MEKKSLIIKNFSGDDVEIFMEITSYSNNNQLAILLYEKESGEYYCDLSVNVKDFPDENKYWDYIAVDINNCPNAEEFMQRNAHGAAQKGFYIGQIEDLEILVPRMDQQEAIVYILDNFDKLANDLTEGLPAEIKLRQQQYEYYRDKLLDFSNTGERERES